MVPFVGPSYNLALRKADISRTVNMHLVGMETIGKAPFVLQSVPGYVLLANGGAEVRGCLTTNDRTFWVIGTHLYEQDSAGSINLRGDLQTATGPVDMAYGISQLVIVDGDNGYVFVLATDQFVQITGDAWMGSRTVDFLDNYFLFVRPDTGQFYISALNDATTLDATNFATAEASPDNLLVNRVVQKRLLLMGQYTIEIDRDTGSADFPFESGGGIIETGIQAAHSAVVLDNSVFWVGGDRRGSGIVYRLNGYQAMRISTQAVEQALQGSTDLSQARAYAYQENGLTFYVLNAPGLKSTWAYEVSSGAWHERTDKDSNGQHCADRGICHTYNFGQHWIGGSDGNIYRLDHSVHTKAGDAVVRERISPHAAAPSLTWTYFDAFHLDCTTGDAPQGVDPQVELFWSDDSGATWSNAVAMSTGKVGERFARLTWRRLGRSRDRVWKLRFGDNARFDIVNAQAETRGGTS